MTKRARGVFFVNTITLSMLAMIVIVPFLLAEGLFVDETQSSLSERQKLLLKVPETYNKCGQGVALEDFKKTLVVCWGVAHDSIFGPAEIITIAPLGASADDPVEGIITQGTRLRQIYFVKNINTQNPQEVLRGTFDEKGVLTIDQSVESLEPAEVEDIAKGATQSVRFILEALNIVTDEKLRYFI